MRMPALKPWQLHSLDAAWRAFTDQGHHSVMLQLPTGLGKTRVSLQLYRRMSRTARWKLIIVVRGQGTYMDPWCRDLGWQAKPRLGVALDVNGLADPHGSICIETHRRLSKMLSARSRATARRWLNDERVLVVVDEVHRASGLRNLLSSAYFDDSVTGIPKWMRPQPGPPSSRRRWLLLSATPYNPVSLDYQLDTETRSGDAADSAIDDEAQVLADEVRLTLGLLAITDRAYESRPAIETYIDELKECLREGSDGVPKHSLAVTPRDTRDLRPRPARAIQLTIPKCDPSEAVQQLAHVHGRLAAFDDSEDPRTTAAERLVLGGAKARKQLIHGHRYAASTRKAVAGSHLPLAGGALKLQALARLARSIVVKQQQKVVVFCVHRAVCTAAAQFLRKELQLTHGEVFDACRASNDEIAARLETFRSQGQAPWIVVTTDRLSEATDLQHDCHVLIHYELPWSPLRVMQRVGRLWRIRSKTTGLPRAPNVFHVVHPGGVEEEILWRVHRRWRYLHNLGLGYMPVDMALGTRVPRVSSHGPKR